MHMRELVSQEAQCRQAHVRHTSFAIDIREVVSQLDMITARNKPRSLLEQEFPALKQEGPFYAACMSP